MRDVLLMKELKCLKLGVRRICHSIHGHATYFKHLFEELDAFAYGLEWRVVHGRRYGITMMV